MKKSCLLVPALSLLIMSPVAGSQSGETGIQLSASHQISVDNNTRPHVESHIAVDSRDPRHLLATAMVFENGEAFMYPYVSFDGGETWTRGAIFGKPGAFTGADPLVYFSDTGSSFFVTLAEVNGIRRSVIARSRDGGRTWRSRTILPYADRQWMAFNSSRGLFPERAYFTGTGVYSSRDDGQRAVAPFLARSDDDGQTFLFKSIVGYDRGGIDPRAPINAVPLEPLVTPGGLFILPLQGSVDQQTSEKLRADSLNAWSLGVMISDDGGESFGPARYAPTPRLSVTGSPKRRFRSNSSVGYVRTALNTSSGPHRNRIYFVTSDYDPTIDRYVARVWRTGDFGKTWSTVVASDAPRGDIANPAIAVNRDGVVAVTWNDRRDDPNGRCWQLYASISIDGGEHFLPAQRLSDGQTCTNEPRNWETFGTAFNSDQSGQHLAHFQTGASVPTRFPNGGETQGLAADATGVFHAAWINGETGVLQLWYTSFNIAPELVAELRSRSPRSTDRSVAGEPVPKGMEDVTADIRFRVTKTQLDFAARSYTVTLQIENQSGRALRGPLRVVMMHFLDSIDRGGGLKDLEVANADNGSGGVGATWTFDVPGGVLAPGALSATRVIRFTFEGGIPDVPDGGYLTPGFRVYAHAGGP